MKKTFAVIMAVCILLAMMSGCSIVKSKGRYNTDKYVTLGQYKGVEIDKVEVTPVTQEDIDAYVRQDLLKYAEKIDITPANLSILKTGKAKAIRFSTLESICKVLDCQPSDILEYKKDE